MLKKIWNRKYRQTRLGIFIEFLNFDTKPNGISFVLKLYIMHEISLLRTSCDRHC